MKTTSASFVLFIVIVLCGYVVANGTGVIKIASFIMGLLAAALSIYLYWKNKNSNNIQIQSKKD
jgi:disulfide bond formation protein DsbB